MLTPRSPTSATRYSVMISTLRSCELRGRLPKLTPVPRAPRIREMSDSDDQLCLLLDRGYELAAGHLEGINEAALELADAAGDDRRVMERAFRVVAERVRLDPSHANNQVASLIRRAMELGMWRWDWDDTRPVP